MTTAIEPSADEIELKPCPFCGGKAEIVHIEEGENEGGSCVCCTSCLASGNVEFEFKENFISNWNRRAAILAMDRRAEVDCRSIAVEIVDAVYGYTFEFSSQPDQHRDEYDQVAFILRRHLVEASPPAPAVAPQLSGNPGELPAPAVAVPEGGVTMAALRTANVARNVEWNTGSEPLSLAFRATELAGEVGEACNVLKKLERERIGIKGSRATKDQAAEELADVVICADLIAMDLGIDLGGAVVAKFNATSAKVGLSTMLAAAPEPPATRSEAEIRKEGIDEGVEMAARFVMKRQDDYIAEHGISDPETGATEFPGNGDEYVGELDEIVDGIRALKEPRQ